MSQFLRNNNGDAKALAIPKVFSEINCPNKPGKFLLETWSLCVGSRVPSTSLILYTTPWELLEKTWITDVIWNSFNSIPNDKILDLSKLKQIADNILK